MVFPEQLIPAEIKNQRTTAFSAPQGEEPIQAHPGRTKKSEDQLPNHKEETQSGLQGTLNEEGQPQGRENQKDTRTFEPLGFFYELSKIENKLILFNKLNNSKYTSGIVNLSKYTLQDAEISVLSKVLGFCPTPGAPDIGDIVQDLDNFKRKTRIQFFSQIPLRVLKQSPSPQEDHLNIGHSNSNQPSNQ